MQELRFRTIHISITNIKQNVEMQEMKITRELKQNDKTVKIKLNLNKNLLSYTHQLLKVKQNIVAFAPAPTLVI